MSSLAEGECQAPERERLPWEVWVLITANAVIALGYGVVAPVLPQYARNFGVSVSAATFVITAFALMRLLFAPPTGFLIQRLGERRVYVSGILIVSVTTAACAFVETYWQLLVFRALGGIGSTMFFVAALGLMIRISPENARGRVAGLFSMSFLTGSVAGPVVGSLTAGLGLSAPFIIYGVALIIAAAVVFFSLRHSRVAGAAPAAEPTMTVRKALRQRAYWAALVSNFATGWSFFGLRIALVPLFIVEVLGRSPGVAGLALGVFAAGNASAVFPSGYLSDRIGRRTLLIIGLSVAGLATAILGAASSLVLLLAGAYIAGVAAGIYSAPQQAAVADIIGSKARAGPAVATFQMTSDLGAIVGSFAVGVIAQHVSYLWAFIVTGCTLVAAAIAWSLAPETRPRPRVEPTPARALGPEVGGEVP